MVDEFGTRSVKLVSIDVEKKVADKLDELRVKWEYLAYSPLIETLVDEKLEGE